MANLARQIHERASLKYDSINTEADRSLKSWSARTGELEIQHVVDVDRFYIALFSILEQTQCAHMWFCMSE